MQPAAQSEVRSHPSVVWLVGGEYLSRVIWLCPWFGSRRCSPGREPEFNGSVEDLDGWCQPQLFQRRFTRAGTCVEAARFSASRSRSSNRANLGGSLPLLPLSGLHEDERGELPRHRHADRPTVGRPGPHRLAEDVARVQ